MHPIVYNYFSKLVSRTFLQYNLILMQKISAIDKRGWAGLGLLAGLAAPYIVTFIKNLIKASRKDKKSQAPLHYVGIELGGTNFNIAVGTPNFNEYGKITGFTIIRSKGFKTTECEKTVDQIIQYLGEEQYQYIGIASFGPLCLDQYSLNFGKITTTPKPGWKDFPLLPRILQKTKAKQYGFDTDVNGPAYAEFILGNHNVNQSLVYITVGTGVGIGVIANGKTVHGLVHPEGGHCIVKRHPDEYTDFQGVCPFHKQCVEGYTTNNAIAKRLNKTIDDLPQLSDGHQIWKLVGFYLAQLCLNITLILSPEVIVLGGGIMNRTIIFDHIHNQFVELLNQYVKHDRLAAKNISRYIVSPKVANVGVIGAMALSLI